ncbi:MAG: acetate--CoA ligase family protein [Desulfobacterales bacterium]|nr:acetate--CoA ligase family protein [Desulfobacterales bacterium]
MIASDLKAFFQPAGVAVIGASENSEKIGHEILKNLLNGGFQGAIYPINPKSKQILGLDCYKNVKEVPNAIDLAVMIIPAEFVARSIRDCGEKGIKAAVIITGGFSEAGKTGEELQQTITRVAQEYGIRLIGPNCQGINNPYHRLCASWPLLTRKGRVAIISQSGTVAAAMMDWFSVEELGVSGFVSLGNRADVDESDLIEYFDKDPATEVIALYLEGVKDPARFRRVLASANKPLVILKSGRTPRGKLAAESHTKSLAGTDAIYATLFRQLGICRAETIEEFFDFTKALSYLKVPTGNRILFITTSGGAAILGTDTAEREGLEASPLPKQLAEELEGIIPAYAIRSNPLDLTGDANAKMFQQVIQKARPYYDILGVIFGDPIENASQAVTPGANELIVFLGGAEVERKEKLKMHRQGIPVFPTPERAVRALSQLVPTQKKLQPAATTFPTTAVKSQLSFIECFQLLELKNINFVPSLPANSPENAADLAHQIGFPVALKIDSPDVLHKSDVGGVKLNLQADNDVKTAYNEMMQHVKSRCPEARINGVVVSAMAAPGLEIIMGMNRDPQFGPTLIFGLGGVNVELFRDVSMRLLPLDKEETFKMIGEIRGAALLKGFRGQPPIDENALADALLKLARISEEYEDIVEIDLNPVMAYAQGLVVVDARILKA